MDGRLRLAAATVTGALSLWHLARIERDDDAGVSGTARVAVEVAKTFRLFGPNGGVVSIAFDLESRQIAVGRDDGDVTVWSACDGNVPRAPRRRHKKAVNCLAFHPSGWQLASGSDDGAARVWDIAGMTGADPGTCQHALKWSCGPVTRVRYTARMICTVSATHLSKDGASTVAGLVGGDRPTVPVVRRAQGSGHEHAVHPDGHGEEPSSPGARTGWFARGRY